MVGSAMKRTHSGLVHLITYQEFQDQLELQTSNTKSSQNMEILKRSFITDAELNYMTQIVMMVYEDPTKLKNDSERFQVELHFSPGAKVPKEAPKRKSSVVSRLSIEVSQSHRLQSDSEVLN